MTFTILLIAFLWYVPLFLAPGTPAFKSSGTPAHGDPTTSSCCCHTEAPLPCGNCNATKNPRKIQVTIRRNSTIDHTCLDCAGKLGGAGERVYVLNQSTDSACNYVYCEPDPCDDKNDFGDPCQIKLMALLSNNGGVNVTLGFCDTSPNCSETATPSAIRSADWERAATLPDFNWDCVDLLDDELSPVMPVDGNIDYNFCHEDATIHVKALP